MKNHIRKWGIWFGAFGFDVFKFLRGLKGFPFVVKEYIKFKTEKPFGEFPISLNYPCPADRFEAAGTASGHYFHQDLLVAHKIFERNPKRHVDIGSRIDGFVAHVATFREIEVLDFRPLDKYIRNISFHEFDLLNSSGKYANYTKSLSCLHTLEHLGLGRYGDPIMPDGYVRGFETLYSILKPGGILYLSVPIGSQRIEFNAHRVFSIKTILNMVKDKLEMTDFSYVDDDGNLHESVGLTERAIENSYNCWYGCGIFELRKSEI